MVHKKHTSKRVAAGQRYKIAKKVRDHHRKARRDGKKSDQPHRKPKDPGIPNAWPYKEELLLEIEERKVRAEEEREQRRAERQNQIMKNRTMEEMVQDAEKRTVAFDQEQASKPVDEFQTAQDATATGQRDNSRKAYYREFRKVIQNADVILEVLDARDPLGCRTRQVEELILQSGGQKRIILLLNKIDLVPRNVADQWLKYLRNEFPTVAFKASTQQQRHNLGHASVSADVASDKMLSVSECVGADQLVQLLKNYCRSLSLKTAITVGVIGYPNVGKSSVINSLKRSKACNVGPTPGLTKASQVITLDKNLKLLDCPGIVFSQAKGEHAVDAILRHCVKVELLEDPIAPVEAILQRCKMEQLMTIYSIPPFLSVNDFLVHIARQRGRLRKGGVPDLRSAAVAVLQDWNHGRIPYYTLPPNENKMHVSAAIVKSWSNEFKVDDMLESEQKQLDAMDMDDDAKKYVAMVAAYSEVDMNAIPPYSSDEEENMSEDEEPVPAVVPMESDEGSETVELSEEDDDVISSPRVIVDVKPKSKKPVSSKKQAFMSVEEIELEGNQQVGRSLKKQLKKNKKSREKMERSVTEVPNEDQDMAEDDSYDFGSHFAIGK